MIGGSYKYLRGGPGACFLYIAPEVLEAGLRPLDIGWFANADPFGYQRPDLPVLAHGGDGFLESTPPVLTWYQARSGLEFTLAMGVIGFARTASSNSTPCVDTSVASASTR